MTTRAPQKTYRTNWFREVNLRTGAVSSNTSTYVETCPTTGSSNPDYLRNIAKRTDASSNYSTSWVGPPSPMFFNSSCQRYKVDSTVYPPITYWDNCRGEGQTLGANTLCPAFPDTAVIEDIALKRLKNRLANDTQQFSALVPLAEIKEMRGLINQTSHLATDAVRLMLDVKHGKFRDAHKRASDLWLGFSFGVSPLIADTKAAAESVAAYLHRPPGTARYTGSAHDVIKSRTYELYSSGCSQHDILCGIVHDVKVVIKAGVRIDLQNAANYSAAQHFGVTPGMLPSVAWELVPFSWVADYFTTFGDALEDAFQSPPGSTIYCTKSILDKMTLNFEGTSKPYVTSGTIRKSFGSTSKSTVEAGRFSRISLGSLPHRSFRVKTLDEIGVNSLKRLLNLSSILAKSR